MSSAQNVVLTGYCTPQRMAANGAEPSLTRPSANAEDVPIPVIASHGAYGARRQAALDWHGGSHPLQQPSGKEAFVGGRHWWA